MIKLELLLDLNKGVQIEVTLTFRKRKLFLGAISALGTFGYHRVEIVEVVIRKVSIGRARSQRASSFDATAVVGVASPRFVHAPWRPSLIDSRDVVGGGGGRDFARLCIVCF